MDRDDDLSKLHHWGCLVKDLLREIVIVQDLSIAKILEDVAIV